MASQAIHKSLLKALKYQDFEGFRSIIRSVGLPRDSTFIDYDLLTKAIKIGCKRIANLLLDKGARVFKKAGLTTPLHYAAAKADLSWTKIIERLLEKGACVGDKNSRGETALHLAFANRAPGELIDFLLKEHLEYSYENLANKEKLSFLHIACSRPDVQVVAKLVGTNMEKLFQHQVSGRSESVFAGYNPLHLAVINGNHNVADYLLNCNCLLVYAADGNQVTPLHLAIERRDVQMIDLILSHDKARCFCINRSGLSHFMAACAGSNSTTVDEFLCSIRERYSTIELSTLVNSRVEDSIIFGGYTPLHFAAEFGRPETIEALLLEGADCCAMTYRGLTVHEVAKENVQDLLQSHCSVFKECEAMSDKRFEFGDFNGNFKGDVTIESEKSREIDCRNF